MVGGRREERRGRNRLRQLCPANRISGSLAEATAASEVHVMGVLDTGASCFC